MSLHHTLAALFLVAGSILPAQNSLAYAPGTHRYHLLSVVTRTQEVAGQKSQFKLTNEQQLSMELAARGKDTLSFSYTLDSSRVTSDPPITLPDISKMRGTKVTGIMSPNGRVYKYSATALANDGDSQNLIEGMSRFLATIPKNVKTGSKWTDTSVNEIKRDGNNLNMRTITTSEVVGDTTFAGQKAWRVQRISALSVTGTQSLGDTQLRVEGDGSGNGMYYLSTTGTYLGSSGTQSMKMTIIQPSGEKIPVTQVVTSTVELRPNT